MRYPDFLKDQKVDAFITADENTMWYFTRFKSSFGYAVLLPCETLFLTDDRYAEGAKAKIGKEVTVISVTAATLLPTLQTILSKATRVGFQAERTTVAQMDGLQGLNKEFVPVDEGVLSLSSVKTEEELSFIRRASEIAEQAYQAVLLKIHTGVTERMLAAALDYEMQALGAEGPSFSTIVAFGENSAVPHHAPSERALRENEPVLMDFGALYHGYCSDMTRTVFYGTPTKEFSAAYTAVQNAHLAAASGIKSGVTGREADAIARRVLQTCGYEEAFTHSLGHGIGVNIHENPRLTPRSSDVLQNGMVFSNEPGVYFPGKFGIRIENTAYLWGGEYHTFMTTDLSLTALSPKAKI